MMGKTIMVVDDNPDLTFSVKQGLEEIDTNYTVITAASAKECLTLLNNNQIPDLILLDIMMPETSGWELFDKIKQNLTWKDIPIVFLTARTDKVAKSAGNFLGDDYIEKPFDVNDLNDRINKVLAKNIEKKEKKNISKN